MDFHTSSLNIFELFERQQDQLEANSLLKLTPAKPRYTVNAYKGTEQKWEDWAYDDDELNSLKKIAAESGLVVMLFVKRISIPSGSLTPVCPLQAESYTRPVASQEKQGNR